MFCLRSDPEDPAFLGIRELPRKAAPASVVLNLLPYQEEGFGWMVAQEEEEEKLVEEGESQGKGSAKGKTKATATAMKAAEESNAAARPVTSVRGGILADEMGMGKTLQTICLFCHDKEQAAVAAAMVPEDKKGKGIANKSAAAASSLVAKTANGAGQSGGGGVNSVVELPKEPLPGPTLVVAPSSAMWQWHDEVLRSVAPGALKVAMFYGGARNVIDLDAYDVVITTYPVSVSLFLRGLRGSFCFSLCYFLNVLRNRLTKSGF